MSEAKLDEGAMSEVPLTPVAKPDMDDARVRQLYSIAKMWASSEEVNAGSIITFATTLMSSVEELITEKGSGPYKKSVVLSVLGLVLENDVVWESEATKQTILSLLRTTIPPMIDTIVKVAKGEIDIHKYLTRFSPCCFPSKTKKQKKKKKK